MFPLTMFLTQIQLTAGDWITLAGIAFIAVGGWFTFKGKLEQLEKDFTNKVGDLKEYNIALTRLNVTVTVMQETFNITKIVEERLTNNTKEIVAQLEKNNINNTAKTEQTNKYLERIAKSLEDKK
ncbi:hypothetical protein V9L05_19950 [Bernardetia sp. Wsw4-3y2]|uniref:hypothetical protein n=1 Tax=Bernardetia sp. Wsw4-3y2 TaxID=3127471 RepID=UPI0030D2C6AD